MKEKFLKKFSQDRLSDIGLNPERPKSLVVEVTSACNHECVFCSYHSKYAPSNVKNKFIDEKLLEDIIIEAGNSGIGYEEIGFFVSGEPLL